MYNTQFDPSITLALKKITESLGIDTVTAQRMGNTPSPNSCLSSIESPINSESRQHAPPDGYFNREQSILYFRAL